VTNGEPAGSGLKKDWSPTPEAFHRLLTWLDEGADSGGATYVEMRRRLVGYFVRRGCLSPEDLADETLNRAARRLHEEGASPMRQRLDIATFWPGSSFSNRSVILNTIGSAGRRSIFPSFQPLTTLWTSRSIVWIAVSRRSLTPTVN
jgi:hypothetical protein